ncbi:MAG: divalent metal cation transporter [Armatimonadetes bacterium]|nr:divalent metal cation transporter [Armatimonadota bacterium]
MTRPSVRRSLAHSRLRMLFAVVGPGIIAATADNDATGILGYSIAGAQFQYSMLWILALCTVALGVCQEICARMGAVTGKGLADLIREEFGVKITLVAMAALITANFATTVAEFAGMLAAVTIFAGPSARFIVLPTAAALIWLLVTRGTYRRVERVLLAASTIYLLYIVSAWMAHPNWATVLRQVLAPDMHKMVPIASYILVAIGVIGTTITPWGQFYVQSSVRDKGITVEEYGLTRLDVYFGACFTTGIAFFIIVACGATLYTSGVRNITDAGLAAQALAPIAGPLAAGLFAFGLFNASCFGAIIVPLSTAYAVTEALGWESGVGRRIREAPLFIGVFTALIVVSAVIVMLFPNHLATLIVLPNLVGAMLLPVILVLMLRLANTRRLMGDYVNGRLFNTIAWTVTAVLIILSVAVVITQLLPVGA